MFGMKEQDVDFLRNYQKTLFENKDNDPFKVADIQRRCLGQLYPTSASLLDNASSCLLLENRLKQLSKTVDCTNGNIYQNKIQEKISRLNINPPHDLKSSLKEIDLASLIKPLSCSTDSNITCQTSENFSESEYFELMSLFKQQTTSGENFKTNKIVNSSYQNNISQGKATKSVNIGTSGQNQKAEESSTRNYQSSFKTATDELQIQNQKKYGNNQGQMAVGGQKRKLGTRRNLNSKFVSPLLSNNGSEEMTPKSDEWPSDVDERLKNIEPKMVELIKSEIMDCGSSIDWNDIAGLEFAKTAIQEAVVWPLLRPDIFTGLRRPPKGILLFGPPGTGKTLIGKCVACQSKSTFFSISASSLTSKWVGDGEKMVRALFAVARCHQPAVIFIDEIDSLLSQRSDTEHESSRRIKTEFLVQLDGATTENEERLLLIGATNRPQELDEAARRRFVKRLYIPLPDYEARLQLTKKLISGEHHCIAEENFVEIAKLSEGYSGADIRTLCAEASLGPIRSLDFSTIESIQVTEVRPLLMEDFQKALARVKSSVSSKDLDQYVDWNNTYGSGNCF